jgi:hypothetical protein
MNTDCNFADPVTVAPHEAEELWWLLGKLEDWLLHASDEARAELGDFVNHLCPNDAVEDVINTLGRYCVEFLHRSGSQTR